MRPDTKAHPNGAVPATGVGDVDDANTASAVEVRVASSWEELIGLLPAWAALVRRAGAGGFSRPEFCIPYWSEAARGPAWVAQAWQGHDLIAVAPMWATSARPFTVLTPIGSGPAARAGLVCRPGRADAVRQLIDSAVGSFTGLLLDHHPGTAVSAGLPARRLGATRTQVLATNDRLAMLPSGPAAVDDADAYDAGHQRADWFVPGASHALPLTLVRTVIDAALRAEVAVVIRDGWRGASIWLAGTEDAQLWCASGSCRPDAEQWSASLAAVSRWAADHGLSGVRLPVHAATRGTNGGTVGGTVGDRDVTVVAASARRLWAAAATARRLGSLWQEAS